METISRHEQLYLKDVIHLIEFSKTFEYTDDALNFLRSELLKLPTI
jgi:hypothetical protein